MRSRTSLFSFLKFVTWIATAVILTTFAASAEIRIVAVGDSGIRGKGVSEGDAYPAQLERALRKKGHQVSVTNQGVNGDTTAGVLARLDGAVPTGTDIAIVKVGVNDRVLHNVNSGTVNANVQEIVRRLRARGVDVYVLRKMGQGLGPALHVEAAPTPGKTAYHLNAAGYAVVVQRTLPAIEAMVKKAEKRHQ